MLKIIEGKTEGNVYANMWGWRAEAQKDEGGGRNGIEEGEDGPRVLAKQEMAGERDWAF